MAIALLKLFKAISNLPATLVANAVYFVRTGEGVDIYMSDKTGNVAYRQNLNLPDVVTAQTTGSASKSSVIGSDAKGRVITQSEVNIRPVELNYLSATATAEVSTTSATFATITGMSHTNPPAGTYLAIFSANIYSARTSAVSGEYQVFIDTTPVDHTLRKVQYNAVALGSTTLGGGQICSPITVNGSQTVSVRMRVTATGSSSTAYCKERSFVLLRIM